MFALALSVLLCAAQESRSTFDTPQIVLDGYYVPAWGNSGRFTAVGDFNGDGHVDLAGEWGYQWGFTYQVLKVWYGDGTGNLRFLTWGDQVVVAQDSIPVISDGIVAVGELGPPDGKDDIVYAYNESIGGQLTAVLRLYVGTAQNPQLYQNLRIPGRVLDVEIADFDGNGIGDPAALLVDASGRRTLRYLISVPANFRTVALPPGDWAQLERGEFTGDGITDLAVVSPKAVVIRSLAPGQKVLAASGPILHGLDAPDSAAGDVDGDGRDDVVLFSMQDGYRVLRQVAPGKLELGQVELGGPATELGDVDGDGDLDGTCCGGGGGPTNATYDPLAQSHFEISLNDGHGHFAQAFALPSLASEHIAGTVDLDEDGDNDLIAGRVIYFNPGKVTPRVSFPWIGPELRPASIGDVDGDGDPDFGLGLDRCRLNGGDGRALEVAPAFPAPPAGETFAGPGFPGDLDGDGATDLLVEAHQGAAFLGLELLHNLGGGSFADSGVVATPAQSYATSTTLDAQSCLFRDLDGDGDTDLVVHPPSSVHSPALQFVALWFQQPGGQLTAGPSWSGDSLVDVADIDGDGLVDVSVLHNGSSSPALYWHQGLGGGSFSARLLIEDGPYGYGFDVDDEPCTFLDPATGRDTIVSVRPGAGCYRYVRSGTSWVETVLPAALNAEDWASPRGIKSWFRAADVNGDGREDVVSWPIFGKGAGLVLSKPTGLDTSGTRLLMEPQAFADVDGDGDLDALTATGIVYNRTHEGALNGARVQYGAGSAGKGGVVPTLGASGPFRVGSTVQFRIRGGRGGAQASLAVSRTRAELPDWPASGVTSWVDPGDPYFQVMQVTLGGPAGVAGAGSATVPFTVPAGFDGVSEYLQVWIDDPSTPGGLSASNGLELDFGAP